MKMHKKESLDFLINLSITLLAAFIGFVIVIEEKSSVAVTTSSIVTILLLLLSIALNQRKKVRMDLRGNIFNQKVKEFMDTTLDPMVVGFWKLGKQRASETTEKFFKEHADLIKNKTKEEVSFYLDLYFESKKNDKDESFIKMKELTVSGVMSEIEKMRIKSFNESIDEKLPRLNLIIDKISFIFGSYVFVLSLLSFTITTVFLLI